MNNGLEIAGISLQLFAGLLVVLKDIFPTWLSERGKSLREWLSKRAFAPGQVVRYSLLVALGTIILWLILTYAISQSGQHIWESVLGTVFAMAFIGGIYLNALLYMGKLLMKWKPRKYLARRQTISVSNMVLFIISIVLLGSVVGVGQLYSGSSQNTLEKVFAFLYIIPIAAVGSCLLVPSFIYLVAYVSLKLPQQLSNMRTRIFWGVVLTLWLIGGFLLLTNAVL